MCVCASLATSVCLSILTLNFLLEQQPHRKLSNLSRIAKIPGLNSHRSILIKLQSEWFLAGLSMIGPISFLRGERGGARATTEQHFLSRRRLEGHRKSFYWARPLAYIFFHNMNDVRCFSPDEHVKRIPLILHPSWLHQP